MTGRVGAGVVGLLVVDAGVSLGRVRSGSRGQPDEAGSARIAAGVVVKEFAHGDRVGNRSMCRPERLAMTAASVTIRVRRVRLLSGGWLARAVVAVQVVGKHGGGEPGPVGVEVPGWDVFEAAGCEIADGELDCGVSAVETHRR